MIQINDLTHSYSNQKLFDSISFSLNKNEKLGIVGRNGSGKTTLLRIIAQEETPDEGSINIPKNYKIGYMKQNLIFTKSNILEEVSSNLPEERKSDIWYAEKILSGLGFSEEDFKKHPSIFSGGYQVRINLAKTLVMDPDLLLLDEPTNYLDIVSIRWLIDFLKNWKKELILITHDRNFMDSVITHIMIIHRCKVRKIEGNTEKIYEQIAKEEEIYEKTRINDEKKRKEIEIFISKFRAKARLAGLVQSRIKTLQKMEKKEKLAEIKDLEFTFNYKPFYTKWMMEVNNLSFGYDKDDLLIKDLSFTISKNDRIGIIGKNGKGKSTLMRLLVGELSPLKGEINRHPELKYGYFGQTNIERLNPMNSIEDEILSVLPEKLRKNALDICGKMMFEKDASEKKISVLSGGEKSRVLLGKIIAEPVNILFLDEPTNHLDMQSSDSLLEALDEFEGAIVIVTHNEFFLNALVNKLIVFDNNKTFLYEGTYNDFLENIGFCDELDKKREVDNNKKINQKDIRRLKAKIIEEKNKILKDLKSKIDDLEKNISQLENELHLNNESIVKASINKNSEEIIKLSKRNNFINEELKKLYNDIEFLYSEYENKNKYFEQELKNIEDII